jgi:hypothetical protein
MNTPRQPIPDRPDEKPRAGPKGPQTPYPVNDPGLDRPGSEPDYLPPVQPGGTPDM